MARISEKQLENAIENALVKKSPAPGEGSSLSGERGVSYVEGIPGGFVKQKPEHYDRELCLDPQMAIAFIYATQPEAWEKLKKFHGNEIKEKFLKRLSTEVSKRGALDVLRKGVKDSGCKFEMAYFRPASGMNPKLGKLYEANIFSFIRQFNYSTRSENSIDLAIFINGLPIFTAELKNPLTGQNVDNAMQQYRQDRDPKEPFFLFGRCLAHFAVDPDLVYMTTRLEGPATFFLPFNQGRYGGAGNSPAMEGYSTSYLWEKIWSKDSILNLIQHFTHIVELEDDEGKKTGKRAMIFPRYHQLDCVRRLVAHARANGTGQRYLIEHSAGSGKSNSIAWLAHQLSVLHDDQDKRVFDSIIVITDRKVLDRQIQHTIKQFEQTAGIVENIDKTSRQLKEALENGKTIIVSTLQKYPMIATQVKDLPGKRFALIIDEAHSSQGGEGRTSINKVLGAKDLEEAAKTEAAAAAAAEDAIVAQMKARGHQKNVSTFAFTATPKPETLELFGTELPDGQFEPFSLYSMRQAIEEKFILDVLQNYVNYRVYWKLLKKIEDDPKYDRKKATYLLRSFIDLHEHAISKKVEVIMEHFHNNVRGRIKGRAKAMIVTRSRLHAVRYKIAVDKYLQEHGQDYKALVAFSGEVPDGGAKFTEESMNGFSEAKTAQTFKQDDYRFLIVAYKFQTGFDQPLLHTMYVDQKLEGIRAVQTLSRINRTCADKSETLVLDFVNTADDIQKAFQPYYEKTILSEGTDPNQLYDIEGRLENKHLYTKEDVQKFADIYFDPKAGQDQIYASLQKPMENYKAADKEDQVEFRGGLVDFVRLYSFLSQILTFADPELEKLYHFCRLLLKYIQVEKEKLPVEIQQNIDMDSYRIEKIRNGKIGLDRGNGKVAPVPTEGVHAAPAEELEPLSQIIKELNEKFGTNFSEEDKVFIAQLEEKLKQDEALRVSIQSNTKENARLTFNHVVTDRLQGMVDTNFKFYKRITDDEQAGKHFLDWLFEKFLKDNA